MATLQRFAMPAWANGGKSVLGEKLARIKSVPGRILAIRPRLESVTAADLISRGFTAMADTAGLDVPAPNRQALFGPQEMRAYARAFLNPNKQPDGKTVSQMGRDDIRFFVLNYLAPSVALSDQAAEGYGDETPWIVYDHTDQRRWMNEALAEKQAANNPPGLFITGYDNKIGMANQVFQPGSTPLSYLDTLSSQSAARSGLSFYATEAAGSARANFQWYPGGGLNEPIGPRPDYVLGYAMSRLRLASGENLLPINFAWNSLESPVAANQAVYNPGWAWKHDLSTGTLYKNNENVMDVNTLLSAILIAHALGGGTVMWDRPEWYSENLADADYEQFGGSQPDDTWQGKNGAATPKKRDGHRQLLNRPMSTHNGIFVGGQWAGELNDRAGWNLKYIAFRTTRNGVTTDWKEPHANNIATILQSGQRLEGFCLATETGNDVGGLFFDPTCPVSGQRVDMRLPSGKIVSANQFGCEPVAFGGSMSSSTITLNRDQAVQLQ